MSSVTHLDNGISRIIRLSVCVIVKHILEIIFLANDLAEFDFRYFFFSISLLCLMALCIKQHLSA